MFSKHIKGLSSSVFYIEQISVASMVYLATLEQLQ